MVVGESEWEGGREWRGEERNGGWGERRGEEKGRVDRRDKRGEGRWVEEKGEGG